MSLDIYLEVPGMVTIFDANYTHNVVPMWDKAGCYDALYKSQGKKAADVLPALKAGLQAMHDDPEGFRALNPPNGWGSYDSAMPWLCNVIENFEANPDATIRVSA
jgi:hypothetical protein